jgi:hypothetical protein
MSVSKSLAVMAGVMSLSSLTVFSGCTSLQDESGALSALAEFAGKKAIVEGVIEYSGPSAQWAGPRTLTLHVTAREGEQTQIQATPDLNWSVGGESSVVWLEDAGRKPAGALAFGTAGATPAGKYPVDFAREQLTQLAKELEDAEDSETGRFTQCLYPVRVRLTRTDGTLLEKNGCRGAGGWEQKASEYASQVLGHLASSRGQSAAPAPAPAAKPLGTSSEARTPAADQAGH